tara:strand:+ start:274 stop:429 length:156 start_codon:yes stop_codon:yes gene_type:complete
MVKRIRRSKKNLAKANPIIPKARNAKIVLFVFGIGPILLIFTLLAYNGFFK